MGDGQILHRRFVKLQNDAGELEVLGRSARTVAAGVHPLFEGVRSVEVRGLTAAPTVVGEATATMTVRSPGVHIVAHGATLVVAQKTWTIKLAAPRVADEAH